MDVTKVDAICDMPRARNNVKCRSLNASLLSSLAFPHVMSDEFPSFSIFRFYDLGGGT